MKKTITSLTMLAIMSMQLYSQIDKEIVSYVDSTELMVNNGRKLIYKELNDSNIIKVKEIYDYLTQITYENQFSAFYYLEDMYINMLSNDWERVDQLMTDFKDYNQKIVYSDSQGLIYALYAILSESTDKILVSCQESNINYEAKRIVELILTYIKEGNTVEEYNALLKAYKRDFKVSGFDDFINGFLPKKTLKGSWCFAFGSGIIFKTDELAKSFPGSASYNMAMDINIQKIYTSLYLNGSRFKLYEPFTATTRFDVFHFTQNESFAYLDVGLKAGYFCLRNDRFHIAPYVSVSGSSLESTRYDDPDDNDLEYVMFSSFTYGAGLHTEILLFNFPYGSMYNSRPAQGWFSIKMDAGYNKILEEKDTNVIGDTPYITCALVLGFGTF